MRIDRIVGVVILTAVAQSAEAGTFLIDDVWDSNRQSILSETKMWAGAGASAHYDGTVDSNDNKWALEANLIIDGKTEFSSTGGKGGNTISAGMVVTCSELNCGASRDFEKCPARSWGHYGVVVIYHQFSIEDHRKDGFMRLTQCDDPCAGSSATGGSRIAAASCVDGPVGGTEPPIRPTECNNYECVDSPILIDLGGAGITLTSLADGVFFDIEPGGAVEQIAWTLPQSADGFLVLERNGNSRIDDGSELFGNHTLQPPSSDPNGFQALAVFDLPSHGGDGDGWITERDAVFSRLRLWRDTNHDGHSDGEELLLLSVTGIQAIELSYVESRRRDRHGNQFRYKSRVRLRRSTTQAVDVFLLSQ